MIDTFTIYSIFQSRFCSHNYNPFISNKKQNTVWGKIRCKRLKNWFEIFVKACNVFVGNIVSISQIFLPKKNSSYSKRNSSLSRFSRVPSSNAFRILGMRRPKEEEGGELNRTEEHGVVLVLGVAGRSKDAKEGLAALERFEGRWASRRGEQPRCLRQRLTTLPSVTVDEQQNR